MTAAAVRQCLTLIVVLACVQLSACAANDIDLSTSKTWYWLGGRGNDKPIAVKDPGAYTILFNNGTAAVQADCNRGNGSYQLQNGILEIGPMALTRAACRPNSLDNTFVQLLQTGPLDVQQHQALRLHSQEASDRMYFSLSTDARLYLYRCRDGVSLDAIYSPGLAQVWIDSTYYRLPQVRSGSGVRYSDGETIFHTKGVMALFTKEAQEDSLECQVPSLH